MLLYCDKHCRLETNIADFSFCVKEKEAFPVMKGGECPFYGRYAEKDPGENSGFL
jgi:hypothetical protein